MTETPDWSSVSVRVERIANGFLVVEHKDGNSEGWANGERLFYPTMEGVEREFVFRLRAAQLLPLTTSEGPF